jgi:hypothetical protein
MALIVSSIKYNDGWFFKNHITGKVLACVDKKEINH